MTIALAVVSKGTTSCRPADQIKRLLAQGKLRLYEEESQRQREADDNLSNCHDAALALMSDLIIAKEAEGWYWVTATVIGDPNNSHSWLECHNWAVDVADARLIFCLRPQYYAFKSPQNMRRRNAQFTKRLMLRLVKQGKDFADVI
jgi:hypothetical protein